MQVARDRRRKGQRRCQFCGLVKTEIFQAVNGIHVTLMKPILQSIIPEGTASHLFTNITHGLDCYNYGVSHRN
jgi:hypothetical protein